VTQRSVVVLEVDRKLELAIVHPFSAISGAAKDVDKFEPVAFYKFFKIFVCYDFKRMHFA